MSRLILRPSPNEETQMLHDELQRRRKLRILQVREQEKINAIRIRRATQEKHEREINILAHELKKKWRSEHEKKIRKSEEEFTDCLKEVGSAQDEAKENAPNQALRDAIAEKNQKDAEERGVFALKHERHIQREREKESIELRRKRHIAMIKERVRAKHIANLPAPHPNPADGYFNETESSKSSRSTGSLPNQPGRYATVRICNHESTMTTTVALGLPSDAVVERATTAELAMDAREEAKKEGERIALLQAEKDKAVEECMEKARVRHQAALEEARLDKESKTLMNDLKHLTMKDGLRRQHHIDYKWDDNILAKKACQELFGPPGLRFKESEMLCQDLHETSNEKPVNQDYSVDTMQSSNATWKDVSQEGDVSKPGAGTVMNRLLKQIHNQRQHQKSGASSSILESDLRKVNDTEKSDISKHSYRSGDSTSDQTDNSVETRLDPIPRPSIPNDEETTIMKSTTLPNEKEALMSTNVDIIDSATSIPKSVAYKRKSPDIKDSVTDTTLSSEQTKSRSMSLLENSLQSMRNDEVLLKSVKDFQQRLLQQHKSSAKIQEQIDRIERKRAAIDARVEDVAK